MKTSLLKLASVFPKGSPERKTLLGMAKKAAGTEADIKNNLTAFNNAVSVVAMELESYSPNSYLVSREVVALVDKGRLIANGILSTRSIPPKGLKPFEMVFRLLNNVKRIADTASWFKKNKDRFKFLIEAAKTWPPKQEGTDELFSVGSFKVHNTLIKGKEVDELKELLMKVQSLVERSGVPGYAKTLYGDVYVVAQISAKNTLAWYFPHNDTINVRPAKHTGSDNIHNLLHELGHRYWLKFADAGKKQLWQRYHSSIEYGSVEVVMPKVGDVILGKSAYTIQRIVPGKYYFLTPEGVEKFISSEDMYNFYRTEAKKAKFPTRYSAQDSEEHFCDALALYCMGKLPPEHEEHFKRIWL